MNNRPKVLVAGIGGASLGTEILKCLKRATTYTVLGCDMSGFAYGHYQEGVVESFVVPRERYVESVLELCVSRRVGVVIPGGEEPLLLLSQAATSFNQAGIHIAANSPEVIATCSDKNRLFVHLRELGLPTPWTVEIRDAREVEGMTDVPYPCVIKPSTGSGGSKFVFLASNQADAGLYLKYLLNSGVAALIQEYIPLEEGEFTIGVLSLPGQHLVGSVVMQRLFHAKLSVLAKTNFGLISSGYSQGLIDEFPQLRTQAENVARALGSTGPLNIQARVRNGVLIPFEINPRFSASTYLRAMAGFNEVDIYLGYVFNGVAAEPGPIQPGYYLRSLSEVFVRKEGIKQ